MRILLFTPILEYPPKGGPQISVDTCVKALNIVSELHIITKTSQNNIGTKKTKGFYINYCNKFSYASSTSNLSTSRYIRKLQKIVRGFRCVDADFLINYYDENDIDLLWCDRAISTSVALIKKIKNKRPDIPIVCDTEAVQSKFILREVPFQKSFLRKIAIYLKGKKVQKDEEKIFNLSNVVTAVSQIDADYYYKIVDDKEKVKLFPNVVDINFYIQGNIKNDFKRPSLFLSGTFYGKNSPMEDGARWFISDILPLVKNKIHDIHLYIIGRNSDTILKDIYNESVSIIGEVDSIVPFLFNSDVVIVPLRFESGTRFKILEAGAAGKPVVSTSLGAEGLGLIQNENILLADDSDSFSKMIIEVICDKILYEKLSINIKKIICEKHSVNELAKYGLKIIEFINKRKLK